MGNFKTKKKVCLRVEPGQSIWEPSKTIFLESLTRVILNSEKKYKIEQTCEKLLNFEKYDNICHQLWQI